MKVLQFGQGNFLRTFADVYFETLNQEGLDYQVYVATAIPHENLEAFRRQGNRYHVVLRGSQGGQPVEQVLPVTCLQEVIDPFLEPEAFYALAEDPELKLIVSNTTEAGIQFHSQDSFEGFADITFPAKMTKFLYRRFQAGSWPAAWRSTSPCGGCPRSSASGTSGRIFTATPWWTALSPATPGRRRPATTWKTWWARRTACWPWASPLACGSLRGRGTSPSTSPRGPTKSTWCWQRTSPITSGGRCGC